MGNTIETVKQKIVGSRKNKKTIKCWYDLGFNVD